MSSLQPETSGWLAFEGGATLGKKGTEGGTIIRDEEHPAGGRITLERDCLRVPYAITCGIYGWMVHTRFIADEPLAIHEYERMKPALAEILSQIPGPDDLEAEQKADVVSESIAVFVEQFA